MNKNKILCLYVPVIHQGYINLLNRYAASVDALYIFGPDLIRELTVYNREIRALDADIAARAMKALVSFPVGILSKNNLNSFIGREVILSRDAMSMNLADCYLKDSKVEYSDIFLRWDESNVFKQEPLDNIMTSDKPFDKEMMSVAIELTNNSSDWWRQVGSVTAKDGVPLSLSWNQHLPSEHTPYINGDPRDFIQAGQKSEFCSAIHSEQAIVADAARKVLEGTDIYVTTFPCPVCAKLLARAGIKRCFFKSGHASLDGLSIFKAFNVEVIRVV